MSITNLRISRKLALGFACVLLVVAIMSGTLFVALQLANAAAKLNGVATTILDKLDQGAAAIFDAANSATTFVVTHANRNVQRYDAAQKRYTEAMAEAHANAAPYPDINAMLDRMDAAAAGWRDEFGDAAIHLVKDPKTVDQALDLVKSPMTSALTESFRDVVKPARLKINAWAESTQKQQDQAMLIVRIALIAGGASATLFSVLIGWWLSLVIAKPVTAMTSAMNRLASGDNAVAVPAMGRKDEIGRMAKAVQTFKEVAIEKIRLEAETAEARRLAEEERVARELAKAEEAQQDQAAIEALGGGLGRLSSGDLVHRIDTAFAPKSEKLRNDFNASVEKLQQTILNIGSNSQAIRAGTGEISSAADDLSRRTEQQAASLEETAASLDQITATVNKTAEGAKHARDVVSATKADAEKSGQIVRQAIEAMTGIEKSSKQISQIIGVIDEIAFQTNLLALNAGVEAARAGDAGRGFAVVASEVRALAQRSAEAAKEIKGLISASTTQVDQGVDLVAETGKALERIVVQVLEMNNVVSAIAASAQEQATGLHQVNTAVNHMDQVTQQNAAMVEQTTAAARALTQKAEELARLVGGFQTGQNAAGGSAKPARQPAPTARTAMRSTSGASAAKAAAHPAPTPQAEPSWEEF